MASPLQRVGLDVGRRSMVQLTNTLRLGSMLRGKNVPIPRTTG